MKNLCVLGSTGSIGRQTLDIVSRYKNEFNIVALSAHSNMELLLTQCKKFKPQVVAISCEKSYNAYKEQFKGINVICGETALSTIATLDSVDTVVAGIVGMGGFSSVYDALSAGKNVALANKESLVSGGSLIMNLAKQNNAKILPVDSEHSAVWQCLEGNNKSNLKRIILTASGGAFFGKDKNYLKSVTVEDALKHPNWAMGKKITIDSATMMNKGLEIIEASFLFDTQNIDYIIHRESVIHSMVEFNDGCILSQMSYPSMEYPIQLALTYPNRLPTSMPSYDFTKQLTFNPPDEKTFIMPLLAKESLKKGGSSPCVLNAVNEACVSLFLDGKIGFMDIFTKVEKEFTNAPVTIFKTKQDVIDTHNYYYDKLMTDNT